MQPMYIYDIIYDVYCYRQKYFCRIPKGQKAGGRAAELTSPLSALRDDRYFFG